MEEPISKSPESSTPGINIEEKEPTNIKDVDAQLEFLDQYKKGGEGSFSDYLNEDLERRKKDLQEIRARIESTGGEFTGDETNT